MFCVGNVDGNGNSLIEIAFFFFINFFSLYFFSLFWLFNFFHSFIHSFFFLRTFILLQQVDEGKSTLSSQVLFVCSFFFLRYPTFLMLFFHFRSFFYFNISFFFWIINNVVQWFIFERWLHLNLLIFIILFWIVPVPVFFLQIYFSETSVNVIVSSYYRRKKTDGRSCFNGDNNTTYPTFWPYPSIYCWCTLGISWWNYSRK